MKTKFLGLFLFLIMVHSLSFTQPKSLLTDSIFKGLTLRNIGPALMSGRIADIVIHPDNPNTWYVAVGSGGVWKTVNAGTTWSPVFDDQTSYSIGCITINDQNPHEIWIGTGENVGGRHVAYGDGVYKSTDDGKSWQNMGLEKSEHISKIIIHPGNSDIIWVAAQGPLWSAGGERGLYKSIDGGRSWKQTLGDNQFVGVTDLLIDPRNPDRLYAATWERHRNVAAYIGGGPGTAIYRSEDGGDTWDKLTNGIPDSDKGKIGLAISPQNPDVVYAAIELERRKGGVYRSMNRGASWTKMSNTVSGGTGPHYYQELYASPHQFDKLYLVDVRMQISEDGGKTFKQMKEEYKHSDNHSVVFRKDDPDYLLVGTDGGIYESFDNAENWRFVNNMPITQFYKVAVDDAEPFYNIYGGTQDNYSQGGPSRTDNLHGIRNDDWFVTLFADGHQSATEPGNPDITYAEYQQGHLYRIDHTTGEVILIQPQPGEGEGFERFNWDAPILVSPHSPTRLYFASHRVWRSDDRGDSWMPISNDLTRNQERLTLPMNGKTYSWDAAWDIYAMSSYNTITSISESPVKEGLIYIGTDDGIIQVTEDGGENWKKIEVGNLPGVPETAFVNDIKADLYDENIVYIALDNHKFGDYNPYLLKSQNKGKTWTSIRSNIPERTLVWRIVQDHVKQELMFCATEFGIYFTINSGKKWVKLKNGVPTISFRDLAIQKRENDLVGASFGRGFFVFDDYSVLRHVSEDQLQQEATLFPTRKAWWYIPRAIVGWEKKGSQGASHFVAPNPPFGAVFTYYLNDSYKTKKEIRQEKEKELKKENANISFPGWDAVEEERREEKPVILLIIKDEKGNVIRKIESLAKQGFHRVAWDLRYPSKRVIDSNKQLKKEGKSPSGFLAPPGKYTVSMAKKINGEVVPLSEPQEFIVERLRKGAIGGTEPNAMVEFNLQLEELHKNMSALSLTVNKIFNKINAMESALKQTDLEPGEMEKQLHSLRMQLNDIDEQLSGNKSKSEVGEKDTPTISDRLYQVYSGIGYSTYGPTPNLIGTFKIAEKHFKELFEEIDEIIKDVIPKLESELVEAGAPLIR